MVGRSADQVLEVVGRTMKLTEDQSLAIDKLLRRPGPALDVTSAIMRTVELPRQVVDRLDRASRFCSASAGCDRVSRP